MADQRPILGPEPATQRDEPGTVGIRQISTRPAGGERPVAEDEAHVLLIEPCGTPNTGDAATTAARRVI
jgi:hypothetical protein